MIVKMKKITLLVSRKTRTEALTALRNIGVLHIHTSLGIKAEEIDALQAERGKLERAMQAIGGKGAVLPGRPKKRADAAVVEKILQLAAEKEKCAKEAAELALSARWFDTWGRISFRTVNELKNAGIHIRFYRAPKSALKKLTGKTVAVFGKKGALLIVHFGESGEDRLPFTEDPMPEMEYSELKSEVLGQEREALRLDRSIESLRPFLPVLREMDAELARRLEFSRVYHGMEDAEHISALNGYCPEDRVQSLRDAAAREGWAYIVEDPDDFADVPTLVRNRKPVGIIKPVFSFMGTLPGYDEYDISFWFLLFFSLFFAMLIGDAGYGTLFLILTLVARRKMSHAPGEIFYLLMVLCTATILWGAVTGTWFGYEGIARLPFFNRLIIDKLYSYADDNQQVMMYVCFLIGSVHLTIAHGLRAIRNIRSLHSLSHLGWIANLWVIFFVAGNLVLNRPLPPYTIGLFIGGTALILFFTHPEKNILKGALKTLVMDILPLNIISAFSDVVSYLRLFAVGFASVTMASSFNQMVASVGFHSVLNGLIASLILFLGHALNVTLGVMSVLVHGVRLNLLEFSGHLGMQWSGKPYQPFRNPEPKESGFHGKRAR